MASDPCKQSEAMIKISKLFELPIVCEALHSKPGVAASGFPFISLLNTTTPVTVDNLDNSSAIFAYGTSGIFLCSASAS